jgi:hypothetical protein
MSSYDQQSFLTGIEILDTTESTNTTTGSLVTYGGVSILKKTNLSGSVEILNTTQSQSTTTGSLIVRGGIGVVGNTFLNNITVASVFCTGQIFQNGQAVSSSTTGSQWQGLINTDLWYTGGNIGIGTSTPQHKLDIDGNIRLQNATSGIILNAADRPLITRGWDQFTSGIYNGVGRWGLFMEGARINIGLPNNVISNFGVSTYNVNSTIDQTRFFVNGSSGNVGIGTITPTHKLQVVGDAIMTGLTTTTILTTNASISNMFSSLSTISSCLIPSMTNSNLINTNLSSSSINVSGRVLSRVSASGFNSNFTAFPVLDTNECAISFFQNTAGSTASAGSVWTLGHNVFSSGNRTFTIGTPILNSILTMHTSGQTQFNYNVNIVRANTTPSLVISGGITSGNGANIILKGGGLVGSSVNIDLSTYDHTTNAPTSRIQAVDENFSSNLILMTKIPGSATNSLAPRMYIRNDGNIGINTTVPNHLLHVNGGVFSTSFTSQNNILTNTTITNGILTGQLNLVKDTGGWSQTLVIRPSTLNGESYMAFHNISSGSLSSGSWLIGRGGGDNKLEMYYAGAANSHITSITNGNVGIFTNSPSHRLHVNGGLFLDNNTSGVLLSAADRPMITRGFDPFVSGNYSGAGRWGLFMEGGATTLGIPAGGSGRRHQFVSYNDNSTINTTYMTILETGNVGIGITTPSHKLQVVGGSFIDNLTVSNVLLTNTTVPNLFATTSTLGSTLFTNNITVSRGLTAPIFYMEGGIGSGTGATLKLVGGGGVNSRVQLDLSTYNTGVNDPSARIMAQDDNFSSHIHFQTKNTGNASNPVTTRLFISNDGNIGIGTTTPSSLLSVNGSAIITTLNNTNLNSVNCTLTNMRVFTSTIANTLITNSTLSNLISSSISSSSAVITGGVIVRRNTSGWNPSILLQPPSSGNENFMIFNNNITNAVSVGSWLVGTEGGITGGTFQIGFAGTNPYAFSIATSGNIGIRTINPSTALQVNGVVLSNDIIRTSRSGDGGSFRVNGSDSAEKSIGFYRNSNESESTAGDAWILGHNVYGAADRQFGLGCTTTGLILKGFSSGEVGYREYNGVFYTGSFTIDGTSIATYNSGSGLFEGTFQNISATHLNSYYQVGSNPSTQIRFQKKGVYGINMHIRWSGAGTNDNIIRLRLRNTSANTVFHEHQANFQSAATDMIMWQGSFIVYNTTENHEYRLEIGKSNGSTLYTVNNVVVVCQIYPIRFHY